MESVHAHPPTACLAINTPGFALATATAHDIQAVRVKAFSICSNLLVYYSPNIDGGDQKHLDRYRQSVDQLQKLLLRTQDPELQAAGKTLLGKVVELERQPSSSGQLYPTWINPLLEAQAQFDHVANQRYVKAPPEDPFIQALYRQSLDIRTFCFFTKYAPLVAWRYTSSVKRRNIS